MPKDRVVQADRPAHQVLARLRCERRIYGCRDVSKDAALVQWVFEQPHPTAPTKECRGHYWTPSPAELDDVSDDSLRVRSQPEMLFMQLQCALDANS